MKESEEYGTEGERKGSSGKKWRLNLAQGEKKDALKEDVWFDAEVIKLWRSTRLETRPPGSDRSRFWARGFACPPLSQRTDPSASFKAGGRPTLSDSLPFSV